jgi:phosphohistidine phosphatase
MKTLILIRHAEADNSTPDKERRLTQAGISQAFKVGGFLSEKGLGLQKIFHSSAERTTMTAETVSDIIKLDESLLTSVDELYNASLGKFLEFVNSIDDSYDKVAVVGHNPAISYLAEYFVSGENIAFSPSQMACIHFDLENWSDLSQTLGKLEWFK